MKAKKKAPRSPPAPRPGRIGEAAIHPDAAAPPPPFGIRNPTALVMLLLLSAAVILSVWLAVFGLPAPPQGPPPPLPLCNDGETKPCSAGDCNGTSTCSGGEWGGCRWVQSCTPGSVQMCFHNTCAYAVRVCNECGTGFGPCGAPE